VYRYRPGRHDLLPVAAGDPRVALAAAAAGQEWVAEGPAVIVVTAVYERTTRKYGQRGVRYARMEAGAAVQNVYLQAAALGLGTVCVGAFHDERIGRLLGLPEDHEPLALMPVGRRP
jgi:SagB-type dehydrogenase family enzyme